jgi:hypothetical protein
MHVRSEHSDIPLSRLTCDVTRSSLSSTPCILLYIIIIIFDLQFPEMNMASGIVRDVGGCGKFVQSTRTDAMKVFGETN